MTTAAAQRKNIILSVLMTCVGYAFYNIGDAALKTIGGKFHFSQIFLLNNIFVFSFVFLYGLVTDGKKSFSTRKPKLMLMRACLAQVISWCTISSLPHIPLTTFYTVVFTSPFWVALLAAGFMKEKLEGRRISVILFGFLVVLFIFRPGGGLFSPWTLLVLTSAFIYSIQVLMMRRLGPSESRPFMIMWGSSMGMLVGLFFLPGHYIAPTPYEWGLFFMMGTTGGIGILCVSYAFQSAPSAAVVAPYHYTQIVWGALLGYYLFREVPRLEVMVGAALIIAAGLYLVHHETRRSLLKPAEV
jgi:drug/metabolite transporter (DMT)-like permease